MTVAMKLDGIEELVASLNELENAAAKPIVRRALAKAAKPVEQHARSLVPVGPIQKRRNGSKPRPKLRDEIRVSTNLSPRQKRGRPRKSSEVYVYVGAGPARHAHLVEFGTKPRTHKNGKSVGQMPARPFMRPAWEANKQTVLATFTTELRNEIAKAARRALRKAGKS